LSHLLEASRPPDPESVDFIAQAFLEDPIESQTTEPAYLWLMGKIRSQKRAHTSIGLFASYLLN